MPVKNYYELLEIAPSASGDDIKRAFRHQIALYHPDKVQHLGKEFQEMAATRAAELTEAYRILSDAGRRAEYDRLQSTLGGETPASAPATPAADKPSRPVTPRNGGREREPAAPAIFSEERGFRDAFVRKAAVGRVQRAVDSVLAGGFDQRPVSGFDLAVVPKAKLFARARHPPLLVRFVPHIDAGAIGEAWVAAVKWVAGSDDEVCVLLIGSAMAPTGELAGAIAEQRRRRPRGAKVTLVPIDARDWAAHMPTDAPPVARSLLDALRARS